MPVADALPRIRPLPTLVANQIAAGEVVERPASVVKELVENALDAGATRVRVDLDEGGIELVRVTDDGRGIHPDDLPLAVAPHATSKIASADDLEHVATLGFRGEALASIASVARLSIRSRVNASDDAPGALTGESVDGAPGQAWLLEAEGDLIRPPRPEAGPPGTCVTVRNLFFNTPARRKFLRTVPTEQGRCLDAVRELALAHPSVAFEVVCNGRRVIDLPARQHPRARTLAVLGAELEAELLEVSADDLDVPRRPDGAAAGVTLWGVVGRPSIARATSKAQYLFVNGRCVRDRTIQHALAEAFRGLIEPTRHPTAVLMLEVPPASVDVNVHPAKAEVRFRDSSLVHSVVLAAVRRATLAADLTPIYRAGLRPTPSAESVAVLPPVMPPSPAGNRPPDARAFADYFTRHIPAQTGGNLSYDALRDALERPQPPVAAAGEYAHAPMPQARPADRVLQVHNSYLVTQDETGVLIVDQHALHERVMFQKLLDRIGAGNLETQRLLTPVVVPASERQVDRLHELQPLFARIGIEAEGAGPRSVAVHAFTSLLFERNVDPVDFLTDLLERHESRAAPPTSEAALHEVLDMMACKAAVKAGDRLSDAELDELLRLREHVERASNCPHGRPTSIRLTIRELEKLFHR